MSKWSLLLATCAFYSVDWFRPLPLFETTARFDHIVTLGSGILGDTGVLSLAAYLVGRDQEGEFVAEGFGRYNAQPFTLISMQLFRLQHFPHQQAALVFYHGSVIHDKGAI